MTSVRDLEQTVIKAQNGTPLRISDVATVTQGPKIRLGQIGKTIHRADGHLIDSDDVVEGIVLLRKGAESDSTLKGIEAKVQELNDHILPPGVKVVPFLDRSDLVHYTTHTVLKNLTEGIVLVVIVLFVFLGNARGALIVGPRPFRSRSCSRPSAWTCGIFPPTCCHSVRSISAWSSTGRWSWWRISSGTWDTARCPGSLMPAHPRGGSRGAAPRFLCHCHHHHGLLADLHPPAGGGAPVQTDGVDRRVCAAGSTDFLDAGGPRPGKPAVPRGVRESGTTR